MEWISKLYNKLIIYFVNKAYIKYKFEKGEIYKGCLSSEPYKIRDKVNGTYFSFSILTENVIFQVISKEEAYDLYSEDIYSFTTSDICVKIISSDGKYYNVGEYYRINKDSLQIGYNRYARGIDRALPYNSVKRIL